MFTSKHYTTFACSSCSHRKYYHAVLALALVLVATHDQRNAFMPNHLPTAALTAAAVASGSGCEASKRIRATGKLRNVGARRHLVDIRMIGRLGLGLPGRLRLQGRREKRVENRQRGKGVRHWGSEWARLEDVGRGKRGRAPGRGLPKCMA